MTDAQKHAALIHKIVDGWIDCPEKTALLAGAEALEAQEEWIMRSHRGKTYMIPHERAKEWLDLCYSSEPGEYTAIPPQWAKPVADDVVVTGWRTA